MFEPADISEVMKRIDHSSTQLNMASLAMFLPRFVEFEYAVWRQLF